MADRFATDTPHPLVDLDVHRFMRVVCGKELHSTLTVKWTDQQINKVLCQRFLNVVMILQ